MLKKILIGLGASVALLVVLIAAVLGYAFYANDAAEKAAKAFCGSISIGSDVESAASRAAKDGLRDRGTHKVDGKEERIFTVQGWVFNQGICRLGVVNGKVTSAFAALEGD